MFAALCDAGVSTAFAFSLFFLSPLPLSVSGYSVELELLVRFLLLSNYELFKCGK